MAPSRWTKNRILVDPLYLAVPSSSGATRTRRSHTPGVLPCLDSPWNDLHSRVVPLLLLVVFFPPCLDLLETGKEGIACT